MFLFLFMILAGFNMNRNSQKCDYFNRHSANNQGYKLSKQKLNLCSSYTLIPRDLRGIAGEHRLIACCVAASLKLQKTFVSK